MKKIIQSAALLLPAAVVALTCVFGLSRNPINIISSEAATDTPETSIHNNSKVNDPETTDFFGENDTHQYKTGNNETAQSQQSVSSKTDTVKKAGGSKVENSQKQVQTSQSSVNRKTNSNPDTKKSDTSAADKKLTTDTSRQQTASQSENSIFEQQQTHQDYPQASDKPQTQSRQENSQVSRHQTEQSRQETTQTSHSAKPAKEEISHGESQPQQESSPSSPAVSEVNEVSSDPSESPAGKYIDGTYNAVAEVDGMDEEGFLYNLEITITISGGELTSINGRIKNDRSEDPASNEAYVRRAVKKLSEVIIPKQDTDGVDIITNATYSSNAVLKATTAALAQAER